MAGKKTSASSVKQAGDYMQVLNIEGYINNREITNLPGQFLVPGSYNTLIKNNEKVYSRNGVSLLGASKTSTIGTNGGYDWNDISSGNPRSIRQRGTSLEVYYSGAWLKFFTLPFSLQAAFATWWSSVELIDFLIFANGASTFFEWSGAITKIASVSPTSITKTEWISSTDIGFVAGGTDGFGNPLPGTITKTTGGFAVAQFKSGQYIQVQGSLNNNNVLLIKAVTNNTLVIDPAYPLTTEAALGNTITIQLQGGSTWAVKRFHTANGGLNNDRSITINGVSYPYISGENSGVLQLAPIAPDPTQNATPITASSIAYQTVRSYQPSAVGAYAVNLLGCIGNNLIVGSTSNRTVLISKASDFTAYTFGTPRIPGDGGTLLLDACPTAFAFDGPASSNQSGKLFHISAGKNFWYEIKFDQAVQSNGDGTSTTYETIDVQKLPTGTGSAAISQDAVIPVKNGFMIITNEPTIDILTHMTNVVLDSPQSVPYSDPIKDDVTAYNFAGVHGVYIDRTLWINVPKNNVTIAFDFVNRYWQPPQIFPALGRLAVIYIKGKATLCGHAANCDETYVLLDPLKFNDNGIARTAVAAFGYENYGTRFGNKMFTEMAAELYIRAATLVYDQCNLGYKGSAGVRVKTISVANNPNLVESPSEDASEGALPEGYNPEGSTTNDIPALVKARVINDVDPAEFIERQRIFSTRMLDGYFELLCYGENVEGSATQLTSIHQ